VRPFRAPVQEKQYIRGMLFGGFLRCLYLSQKFQSDTERRFAVILEDEKSVLKWFKPAPEQFPIYYRYGRGEQSYEPDFIVETITEKLMCEVKSASEMDDPVVNAKAAAATVWCKRATEHERAVDGKPWTYMLIPHDEINSGATLAGLRAKFGSI
jgi:type III restriction enzyme